MIRPRAIPYPQPLLSQIVIQMPHIRQMLALRVPTEASILEPLTEIIDHVAQRLTTQSLQCPRTGKRQFQRHDSLLSAASTMEAQQ